MQANRGRDTKPELALRSLLHSRGLRFRVGHPLPFDRRRRADITFTRVNLFVFVDGCYWHGCPEHFQIPQTNTDFWMNKIRGNRVRDVETTERLESMGATVLRFWEHEDSEAIAAKVAAVYLRLRSR